MYVCRRLFNRVRQGSRDGASTRTYTQRSERSIDPITVYLLTMISRAGMQRAAAWAKTVRRQFFVLPSSPSPFAIKSTRIHCRSSRFLEAHLLSSSEPAHQKLIYNSFASSMQAPGNEKVVEVSPEDTAYEQAMDSFKALVKQVEETKSGIAAPEDLKALETLLKPLQASVSGCSCARKETVGFASLKLAQLFNATKNKDRLKALSHAQVAHKIFKSIEGSWKEEVSCILVIAEAHLSMGTFENAAIHFGQAESMLMKHNVTSISQTEENPNSGKTLLESIRVRLGTSSASHAMALQRKNELRRSIVDYKKALKTLSMCPGQENFVASIEGQIGYVYLISKKPDEAVPFLENSIRKTKILSGQDSEELLELYSHLGTVYAQLKKFDKSLVQFEAAEVILRQNLKEGKFNSTAVPVYNNISSLLYVLGRYDAAIEPQRTLVDLLKKNKVEDMRMFLEDAEKKLEVLIQEANARKNKPST